MFSYSNFSFVMYVFCIYIFYFYWIFVCLNFCIFVVLNLSIFICIFVFAYFSFVHFIWSSKSIFSINVFLFLYMCICVFVYLRKCVFHISSPLTRWRVGASSWESESLLMIYASRRKPTENWKQRKVCENTEENISVEALKKSWRKHWWTVAKLEDECWRFSKSTIISQMKHVKTQK